jgi:hypothetical protein
MLATTHEEGYTSWVIRNWDWESVEKYFFQPDPCDIKLLTFFPDCGASRNFHDQQ